MTAKAELYDLPRFPVEPRKEAALRSRDGDVPPTVEAQEDCLLWAGCPHPAKSHVPFLPHNPWCHIIMTAVSQPRCHIFTFELFLAAPPVWQRE